jgi:hypothetical protein
MQLYLKLDPFPEVPAVLRELRSAGFARAILFNGTPAMPSAGSTSRSAGRAAELHTGANHRFLFHDQVKLHGARSAWKISQKSRAISEMPPHFRQTLRAGPAVGTKWST